MQAILVSLRVSKHPFIKRLMAIDYYCVELWPDYVVMKSWNSKKTIVISKDYLRRTYENQQG